MTSAKRASDAITLVLSMCGYLFLLLALIGILAHNWLGTLAAIVAGGLFLVSTGPGRWRFALRLILFAVLAITFAAAFVLPLHLK